MVRIHRLDGEPVTEDRLDAPANTLDVYLAASIEVRGQVEQGLQARRPERTRAARRRRGDLLQSAELLVGEPAQVPLGVGLADVLQPRLGTRASPHDLRRQLQ